MAWGLPLAAASFWAGLLAWEVRPGAVKSWPAGLWVAVGVVLMAVGSAIAPRARRHDPLAVTRLASTSEPGAIEAVAAPAGDPSGRWLPALALVSAGVVACGVGWGGLAVQRRDASPLARLAPRVVEVRGTLREDPGRAPFGWSALLDVGEVVAGVDRVPVRETVWAGGPGPPPVAVRGDVVRAIGSLRVPDDPGFAEILHQRGIAVAFEVTSIERLGGAPSPVVRAIQAIRRLLTGSIDRVFPPREAGLLLGLALGDDARLDPSTERDFRATGLTHLLVVSGGNVAMVLAPVLAVAGALGLARIGTAVLGVGTVVAFVILTGGEPSVLRAGVMAAIALVGAALGRPRATGVVLAAAVFFLVVVDPWLVRSVGFQLSVAATCGLVALAVPLRDRLARVLPLPVAAAAGTTLAAQLAVAPLLLFHFEDLPLVTIPANVAAAPCVAPSLLLGLLAAVGGLLADPVGRLLAALALLPMRALEAIANGFARAPLPHVTSRGGVAVLVMGGVLVAAIAVAIRVRWRPPRPVLVGLLALLPMVVCTASIGKGPPDGLMVRAFDVGQGDASLVTSPAGAAILIDGGPEPDHVATELAALGIKRLDVVVATHAHADHIVGLPSVLARFPVGLVVEPGCPDRSPIQAELDRAIADERIRVITPRAGDAFTVGDLVVEVLAPDRCWAGTESDANNDSLILRVTLGSAEVLFAGDAEEPAQEALLETGVDLDAPVLKVPHHGGATSLPGFFDEVAAEVAVVSVGENDYGHPTASALNALAASGAEVWRTDQHGTITVTFHDGVPFIVTDR